MGLNDVPKTPAEREKARVAAEQRRIRLEAQKRALAEKMARAYEDAKTQREAAAAKAPRKTVLVFPTSSKGSSGPVPRAKVDGTISDQELFSILSRYILKKSSYADGVNNYRIEYVKNGEIAIGYHFQGVDTLPDWMLKDTKSVYILPIKNAILREFKNEYCTIDFDYGEIKSIKVVHGDGSGILEGKTTNDNQQHFEFEENGGLVLEALMKYQNAYRK